MVVVPGHQGKELLEMEDPTLLDIASHLPSVPQTMVLVPDKKGKALLVEEELPMAAEWGGAEQGTQNIAAIEVVHGTRKLSPQLAVDDLGKGAG